MRSIHQLILLALVGLSSCQITFTEAFSWINCQMHECCDEPYIKPDFNNMTKELEKRVFGQHIVERIVVPALQAHFERQHSKPLVMSFNGMTGVGKNHVAKIIAENIYKNGLDSSHVHHINSIMDFSDKRKMDDYQIDLQDKIFNSVSDCERSMFIFDEVDKLPQKLLDSLKPFLEYNKKMHGVDFRNAIFIFLSNHGEKAIRSEVLARSTKPRETIQAKDLERKVTEEIYNMGEGGWKMSELIKNHLIDHFVPFLPLRREHVRECILVYLREHYVMAAKDDKLVDKIVDELIYFPENEPSFSSSGCKRVEQKATVALAEWRREADRKTKNSRSASDHDEI